MICETCGEEIDQYNFRNHKHSSYINIKKPLSDDGVISLMDLIEEKRKDLKILEDELESCFNEYDKLL